MILVLNAGSSSLKAELFSPDLASLWTGAVTEIGGPGVLSSDSTRHDITTADHAAALSSLLGALQTAGHLLSDLAGAGHRIVHGGADLTAPVRLTPGRIAQIAACIPLAPLHNPAGLAAIEALAAILPVLPQCASFDTAFHAAQDPVATTYALPRAERDKGLRRYGFHGLSYASLVDRLSPLPDRLLALHLGNGASLCAILRGKSVNTTMGYSPLSGLIMGTRAGDIDGMAVLRLAEDHGIAAAGRILNRDSGLRALAGSSDMAAILARDDAEARFAVDHFCHWAARAAGSAIVAMGGLDAVAFTGGIGENAAPVRDRIMAHLAFLGDVPVHIVPADEERRIARDARILLAGT